MLLVLSDKGKGMLSSSEQPLVGEEHCVTALITAAKETTGHGAAMGLTTGKVVSYSTRCKTCRVILCSHNKSTGKEKKHDCGKNHGGSSKSIERDVTCELWSKAPQSGVKLSIYVGDDDSTT